MLPMLLAGLENRGNPLDAILPTLYRGFLTQLGARPATTRADLFLSQVFYVTNRSQTPVCAALSGGKM